MDSATPRRSDRDTSLRASTGRKNATAAGAAPGVLALLLWALALTVLGCSSQTRYKVMSKLFDGVPPPKTAAERAAVDSLAARQVAKWKIEEIKMVVHGPYAAKECGACHALPGTKSFRSSMVQGSSVKPSFNSIAASSGRLARPPEELCVYCHSEKSPDDPGNEGKFFHGPVAAGECTECHNPHQSRNPYMLREKPGRKLCLSCHGSDESDEFAHEEGGSSAGRDEGNCLACHDPHMSERRFLVRTLSASKTSIESMQELSQAGQEDGHD
jgi:predicted CXXCH cytochrome family protein